jgi:hypothetical protein
MRESKLESCVNWQGALKQKALTQTVVKQGEGVKACNYPYNMNQQDALFSINLFQ